MNANQKKKRVARLYIINRVQRGLIEKTPCIFCGKKQVEVHHWDYEPMTTNFNFLCPDHHVRADRMMRRGLTKEEVLRYLSNGSDSSSVE